MPAVYVIPPCNCCRQCRASSEMPSARRGDSLCARSPRDVDSIASQIRWRSITPKCLINEERGRTPRYNQPRPSSGRCTRLRRRTRAAPYAQRTTQPKKMTQRRQRDAASSEMPTRSSVRTANAQRACCTPLNASISTQHRLSAARSNARSHHAEPFRLMRYAARYVLFSFPVARGVTTTPSIPAAAATTDITRHAVRQPFAADDC